MAARHSNCWSQGRYLSGMAFTLSKRDQKVIATILNGGESSDLYLIDPGLPPDQHYDLSATEALVAIEKEAIRRSNTGEDAGALEMLTDLIARSPLYASGYNNRAQLYRSANPTDPRAVSDLQMAIELAQPKSRFLSKMQANVLKNANAQLAAIWLQRADEANDPQLKWEYQQESSRSLGVAGALGDKIMAALALKVNPFAKLCGNMVEQLRAHGEM